jgi:hypothetical protein
MRTAEQRPGIPERPVDDGSSTLFGQVLAKSEIQI